MSGPGYREPAASGERGETLWVLAPDEAVVRVERRDNRRWSREFYPSKATVTIGRGAAADLVVRDPNISRWHCRVIFADQTVMVQDEGSTGGIEIDGRKVTCRALHEGTRVWMCDYWLLVARRPPGLVLVECVRCGRQVAAGAPCLFCQPSP